MVVFGKRESIRAIVVVFGQKLFSTGRSGSIRAKVVVIGQKWIYSGKSGSVRAKNGSNPAKIYV